MNEAANAEKVLSEINGDGFEVQILEGRAIRINNGGYVVVKPVDQWVNRQRDFGLEMDEPPMDQESRSLADKEIWDEERALEDWRNDRCTE